MRRSLVVAGWAGSLVVALIAGIALDALRYTGILRAEEDAHRRMLDLVLQVNAAMAARVEELQRGCPNAPGKLISDPGLGDYPPTPPLGPPGQIPKRPPPRDPSVPGDPGARIVP